MRENYSSHEGRAKARYNIKQALYNWDETDSRTGRETIVWGNIQGFGYIYYTWEPNHQGDQKYKVKATFRLASQTLAQRAFILRHCTAEKYEYKLHFSEVPIYKPQKFAVLPGSKATISVLPITVCYRQHPDVIKLGHRAIVFRQNQVFFCYQLCIKC